MDDAEYEHFFPIEPIKQEMFRKSRDRSSSHAFEFGSMESAGRSGGRIAEHV